MRQQTRSGHDSLSWASLKRRVASATFGLGATSNSPADDLPPALFFFFFYYVFILTPTLTGTLETPSRFAHIASGLTVALARKKKIKKTKTRSHSHRKFSQVVISPDSVDTLRAAVTPLVQSLRLKLNHLECIRARAPMPQSWFA